MFKKNYTTVEEQQIKHEEEQQTKSSRNIQHSTLHKNKVKSRNREMIKLEWNDRKKGKVPRSTWINKRKCSCRRRRKVKC